MPTANSHLPLPSPSNEFEESLIEGLTAAGVDLHGCTLRTLDTDGRDKITEIELTCPDGQFNYHYEGEPRTLNNISGIRFACSYFFDSSQQENIRARGTALLADGTSVRVGTGITLNQTIERRQAFSDAVHFLTEGLVK